MKRFQNYLLLALLPGFLLLASEASAASVLIVNCSTVSGPAELTSAAIQCPQFNLAGETLADIEIVVQGGISGSITLTNGGNQGATGSATTTTSFSFGLLSGFDFVDPIFSASFNSGLRSLSAGQTLTISGLASTPISTGTLGHNATVFAPYTGGGIFDIFTSTSTFFSSGGTGGFFSSAQATSANATATVTYTYDVDPEPPTTVPEPTTLSLLGLGAGVVAVVRRRSNAAR